MPYRGPDDFQKSFGTGFYLAFNMRQAVRYARQKMAACGVDTGFVNVYSVSSFDGLNMLEFPTTSPEWVEFIGRNSCLLRDHDYDIVAGHLFNDSAKHQIVAYLDDVFDMYGSVHNETEEECVSKILTGKKLPWAVCCHTTKAMRRLHFKNSVRVNRGSSVMSSITDRQKLSCMLTSVALLVDALKREKGGTYEYWFDEVYKSDLFSLMMDFETGLWGEGTSYLYSCIMREWGGRV